jgi:NTP pyrophosphatase (non-canonical NTP hydrolase)
MNAFDKIKHWRETFGLPNRTEPTLASERESELAYKLIDEELRELKAALWNRDRKFEPQLDQVADAVADLFFVVYQAAAIHGLDVEEIVDRVYQSNMSKLCDNIEQAHKSVLAYSESDLSTYYEKMPDGKYIIKRTVDNKVLKGVNFKEPDWSDLKEKV